ncbi:MAG: desulfoferrodoxin [Candidatus Nealsonbacteria bacterium]|nr:desulfoferrodoxin [Candidatus Nealsonbacteria bacterium]
MASSSSQIYKCGECGAVVEVIRGGGGTLVCCNQPMDLLKENSTDAAQEKHVPVIEKVNGGVKVTVGSVPHPMQADHWIEWIELIADGKTYRQALQPGDAPQAVFAVEGEESSARAMCNLHGLWKAS